MANSNKKTYGLHTILDFGKHKGKRIYEIIEDDPTYIYWMYDKGFDLTLDVRKASNIKTKARMEKAGIKPKKKAVIGPRENSMLNHLVNHLNEKHFDHAIDEDELY